MRQGIKKNGRTCNRLPLGAQRVLLLWQAEEEERVTISVQKKSTAANIIILGVHGYCFNLMKWISSCVKKI